MKADTGIIYQVPGIMVCQVCLELAQYITPELSCRLTIKQLTIFHGHTWSPIRIAPECEGQHEYTAFLLLCHHTTFPIGNSISIGASFCVLVEFDIDRWFYQSTDTRSYIATTEVEQRTAQTSNS